MDVGIYTCVRDNTAKVPYKNVKAFTVLTSL